MIGGKVKSKRFVRFLGKYQSDNVLHIRGGWHRHGRGRSEILLEDTQFDELPNEPPNLLCKTMCFAMLSCKAPQTRNQQKVQTIRATLRERVKEETDSDHLSRDDLPQEHAIAVHVNC